MNAPPVQYVTTNDGIDIAFTESGEGEAFVFLPMFFNHVQDLWQKYAAFSTLLSALAERFHLINFDSRGMGMSTRGLPEDLTLDAYLSDVDAVVERVGLRRFTLLGSCQSTFMAAHYALRHPDRVSALILINGAVSWNAWRLASVYDRLPQEDWDLFLYNMVPRDLLPDAAARAIDTFKQAMTQSDYLASARVWQTAGLDRLLPRIQTPTLVLHSRDFRLRSVEGPMELARRLPNGRLVLMDSHLLFEAKQAFDAISIFLTDLSERENRSPLFGPNPECGGLLTRREAEVLRLIADGESNREIAGDLVLSLRTVERHITNIYAKIGARGRADATAFALRNILT